MIASLAQVFDLYVNIYCEIKKPPARLQGHSSPYGHREVTPYDNPVSATIVLPVVSLENTAVISEHPLHSFGRYGKFNCTSVL